MYVHIKELFLHYSYCRLPSKVAYYYKFSLLLSCFLYIELLTSSSSSSLPLHALIITPPLLFLFLFLFMFLLL